MADTTPSKDLIAAIMSSRDAYFAYRPHLRRTEAEDRLFAEAFVLGADSVLDHAATPPDAALADGWMPIETAPDGVRILLGPRHAPVVGMAYHKPQWAEDQEHQVNVVHYNGTILVAGYHCSEWRPLPAPPNLNASGEVRNG